MLNNSTINQSKYHFKEECINILQDCEERYKFSDEIDSFKNLVNFSTAKEQPYQRWVRYREGYSTKLVDTLIQRSGISREHYFVADPMMGSGSTLLAAKASGFDSMGMDVNPFCEMITSLKLADFSWAELDEAEELANQRKWEEIDINDLTFPPLYEYFSDDNLFDVLRIRKWVRTLENSNIKKLLETAWFFIIEDCSNRKKDGNGLATRTSPVSDVSTFYTDTVKDIVNDFKRFPLKKNTNYLVTDSANNFLTHAHEFEHVTNKKLGCIIFSPPYANSFNYFESYKMELLFGELFTREEFSLKKKSLVRNYRISNKEAEECDIDIAEFLCDEIWERIPVKEAKTGKKDSRTRLMPNMIKSYFMDMKNIIKELFEALHKGGKCYIVVDQSAYVGVIIPTDVVLALIAEREGFTVDEIVVCRRAATSGQQIREYPYLKDSLRESIVCLSK